MNNIMRKGQQFQIWRKYLVKSCATIATRNEPTAKEKYLYDELMHKRQTEAKCSIVVQVSSEKSFPELYNYCNTYGNIKGAHHYRVKHEEDQHYVLLEFTTPEEALAAMNSSVYNEEMSGVPVRSPFLWFRAASKRSLKQTKKQLQTKGINPELQIIDGTNIIDTANLNDFLQAAPNIDEQINLLYQHTHLNDLGVRLRFIAALQLQKALSGMFPDANAQPFGSSVNGFGKMGCDLDLILRFDREIIGAEMKHNESRLIFHTKENLTNGRSQTQRQMESIGDMLHLFLPGVCHVRRILQARVPIIKYHHEHLNLEIDLSMSNLTGFYMSELLYIFGEMDERVRPLIFCVRRWANTCGLTNPSPGRWITNFSLSCLVIFFLQQMKHPILPTINSIMKSAQSQDIRITEDGINCTFGRDLKRIGFSSCNTSSTSELLLQFFEFYSQFDFNNRAISLNEGRAITKPEHTAMYIVNPLEQVLNVSKNVSLEECERLRIEVRNAAWVLESEVEGCTKTENEKLEIPWGLLNLFKTPEKTIIRPNMFFKPRMVEVSDLFDGKTEAVTTNEMELTEIDFKNTTIKHNIQNIKAQARVDIKQMRLNATTLNTDDRAANQTVTKGRRSR